MQAGACAVIIDVVIDMGRMILIDKKIIPIILMFAAFIAVTVFDVNVIFVILICALVGLLTVVKKPGKDSNDDLS
jgi:chromate transporter